MNPAADEKLWRATEKAEESFTASADLNWFRNRMRRLGHDGFVIRDRVAAIHPSLVNDFDRLEYMASEREARA